MLERNITVTLNQAKEWYNSNNATLKEVALQAFSEKELSMPDFTEIKTFKDALNALDYSNSKQILINNTFDTLRSISKASAAMFKLNIIRWALNKSYGLRFTKNASDQSYSWYPYFRFIKQDSDCYRNELESGDYKNIGKVTDGYTIYDVLTSTITNSNNGLGNFSFNLIGYADADTSILSCATEEIAKYFGEYFGMLIMEAMYGDIVDFNIIEVNNRV